VGLGADRISDGHGRPPDRVLRADSALSADWRRRRRRFSRIKIMLLSDVVRGMVASGVAVLAICNLLQIWHLYLLNLIFGIEQRGFQLGSIELRSQ
jgi:hypothetical protein